MKKTISECQHVDWSTGYSEHMDQMEARHNQGDRQIFCTRCDRWKFSDELCDEARPCQTKRINDWWASVCVHYNGDFVATLKALQLQAVVGQELGLGLSKGIGLTDMLVRVLEHKRDWWSAGVTGPESETEAALVDAYQLVLDWLEYPEELMAEFKKINKRGSE